MRNRTGYALVWLCMAAVLLLLPGAVHAHSGQEEGAHDDQALAVAAPEVSAAGPQAVTAACAGGPTVKGGVQLDECVDNTFQVGGVNKTIRVWYTKNAVATDYTEDDVDYSLQHWISTDAQAVQVGEWFENAWLRYFADSGHHLYDSGCGDRVNVQMEDGIGWSGIAYWASSGNCSIGIDSPMVRGGGGERTVYHEAQHYLQYSYNAGCYGHFKPNYPDNSEFIEGYADLGSDSVNATVDAQTYAGIGYDANTSMYEKSYRNIFNKYFIEQLGDYATPADAWHNIDALYHHYEECDAQDDLYVLDSLIPSLSSGKWSQNEFFLNFFAANWAHTWADPATQPELVYLDDDTAAFGTLANLAQNETIAAGSKSYSGSTPDDYAATYYQVRPQAGCPYVQVEVDGAPGALLGINLMAAKTSAPTKVLRSAVMGEDFVRTFAGVGAHDRIVAAVNSFANNYSYDVDFTCVTPALNILEPRQVSFAMVGDPASPIAFLARWTVKDGASSVRGLPASSFSFDAGGDPITLVSGSFQEVGDEYWATLIPPTKPAGTTFVNFTVTLDGSLSDTENNALLYVDPGNTDIALSFDASGSMGPPEDTIGEGTRLQNAQRSGQVIADLLRPGDRVVVQDWSAKDNPVGCGAPGNGNCELDIRTLLPLTDVDAGNVAALVGIARTQINNISAREWTPLGAGLRAAKDALLAGAANDNPKHVFLLSDGQENVIPFYADIRNEIIDSGVVVNTIGFGPEAPGNLLAQIAGDTGGVYRPVATTISGAGMASAASAEALSALAALDVPLEAQQALAAPVPPGQLGLADVYDYLDTDAQGAARVARVLFEDVPAQTVKNFNFHVDPSVNEMRFVIAGKQPDDEPCNLSEVRRVEVLMPGDTDKEWIPISPPALRGNTPPPEWVIRNNRFDDTLTVPNPKPGLWQFRAVYFFCTITAAGEEEILQPAEAQAPPYDFLMTASVQSTIQLEGRLLGLTASQGVAGDVVTIAGNVLDKTGILTPAVMIAQVQGPSGNFGLVMKDDGANNDGSAGDGIYAASFGQTTYGGGYDVRILAGFKDPADASKTAIREWNGGFWIKGPVLDPGTGNPNCGGENDQDKDCMPDDWERRCKLDTNRDDRRDDPDKDGLTNAEELGYGTLPCRADTDNGGENDGSEVRNNRKPLDPSDDKVRPLDRINIRPLNGKLLIDWTRPFSYTNMRIFVSLDPNNPGKPIDAGTGEGDDGNAGDWLVEGLENGKTYTIWLQGENAGDGAVGDLSDPHTATPKEDPDPPSGAVLIENDQGRVTSRQVTLYISSTDVPLEGAAQGANAHMTDQLSVLLNTVSGKVEMRISNDISMAGAQWEPLKSLKPWTLACDLGEECTVYAQFRDAALNESLIVWDSVLLEDLDSFLPIIRR